MKMDIEVEMERGSDIVDSRLANDSIPSPSISAT